MMRRMHEPAWHKAAAGAPRARVHRLANVIALLAMLLNQPLAMLHAATDEEHLPRAHHLHHTPKDSHAAAAHQHGGEPPAAILHHHTCLVCLLIGSTLPRFATARIGSGSDWQPWFGPVAVLSVTTDKRLRLGDPARAPPGLHPI